MAGNRKYWTPFRMVFSIVVAFRRWQERRVRMRMLTFIRRRRNELRIQLRTAEADA